MALRFPAEKHSSAFFTINIFNVGGRSYSELSKASSSKDYDANYTIANSIILPPPTSGLGENYALNFDEAKTAAANMDLGGMAMNAIGTAAQSTGIYDVASLSTGLAIDPNITPLFRGVNLRILTLTWDLKPRTQADSGAVAAIIKTLRSSVLPVAQGSARSAILAFPSAFGLKFTTGGGNSTFSYLKNPSTAEWVCTNLSISYNDGGTWYNFTNGEPTSVSITMEFKEMRKSISGSTAGDASKKMIGGVVGAANQASAVTDKSLVEAAGIPTNPLSN